jgi:FkbM family methyltransferase
VLIVDVGANTGTFSEHILLTFPNSYVIAVEPNERVCKSSLEGILERNPTNFRPLYIALSKFSGTSTLYAGEIMGSQLASLLPINPNAEWPEAVKFRIEQEAERVSITQNVSVKSVADFLRENEVQSIDFLKIDTQGTDLEILDDFLKYGKVKVATVEIEVDSTNPKSHYFQSEDQLTQLFDLLKIYNYQVFKVTPNGVDTNEYNFFIGQSREEFWEICRKLKMSESPTFGSFWSIMGVGSRANEAFTNSQGAFLKKIINSTKHPIKSYKSVIYKLTR